MRRYVWGALVLHGQLLSTTPIRPELHRLGDEVGEAIAAVAVALRTGSAPTGYSPLRAPQVALAAPLRGASPQAAAHPTPTPMDMDMEIVSESNFIGNSVDTVAHLVGIEPRAPADP